MFANVSQQITVAFIDGHIAAFENLNTMSIIHLFFPYWSYSGPLWKFIAPPIDAITKLQLIIVFCIILKSKKKNEICNLCHFAIEAASCANDLIHLFRWLVNII